MNKNKLTLRNS